MASLTESQNLKVWYARGFTARLKAKPTLSLADADPRQATNFKEDPVRHSHFIEGWEAGEKELHRVLEQIASPGERAEALQRKEKEIWKMVRGENFHHG